MSDSKTMKTTERIVQQGGPGRGPMSGMVGQKADNFGASARRLVGLLRPARGRAFAVLLLGIGSVASVVVGPWLLGKATDAVFTGFVGKQVGEQLPPGATKTDAIAAAESRGDSQLADFLRGLDLVPGQGVDFDKVAHLLLITLLIYVGGQVLGWLQGWFVNDVVQATVRKMRSDVEDKVHRLPLSYFDKQPRGELLSRVTNDIDNVAQNLQQTMSQLLTSLLMVVGVLGMMFWVSPLLALIALISVPIAMFTTGRIMKRSQSQFINQWRQTGKLNGQVEEAISGHALVSVFGRRESVEAGFDEANEELYQSSFRAQFISGLVMPLMMLVGNLNYVIIAVVGGLRVTSGTMSIGDVQAFIQYSRMFSQPITQIASMANLLQSGVASAERVFELLDAEEETDASVVDTVDAARAAAAAREETRGEVAFEGVSFSYDPDEPLIEDLSLVAHPGEMVAIVGPTGAGKTTLVNLIMRFYELNAGRITLDGTDITDVSRAELRSRIGMVLQDTWLFEGTIRDNIAYGRPDATEEEVRVAARATYVDRFVHSLPDGYDTRVDDEGSNLSAGERQLITIARAFLAQPALLILDEATSSVDTRTELLLQHAMAALRTDRTSFVIAHRLSTIRDADLILVMENGRIVEQGSHAELLERDGAFARLHAAQFAAAVS
ncbi:MULTISPECIES: ABC transporter ATP-binding protein [unclassified Nocardioides]|uniref:ABC transporter ATP-binding protein n=1 Tax=unclassified Nocardioides TaxID=2615069 RepID=UPI0006F500D0|nr:MULTISPECIES: ABC transporter ATP-binding protein [unclassified Nocardioides]KRA30920.1 multidrug ABC transporter ATP-binding protein [Nocardioides sp. Root614]KRA87541.1 multidrug ABC transporter ATP-binding protein [Nocardioides sp. Root682]